MIHLVDTIELVYEHCTSARRVESPLLAAAGHKDLAPIWVVTTVTALFCDITPRLVACLMML
jgi:hypothetical protein